MSDLISRQAAIEAVKCGALSAAMVYGRTDAGSTALSETVKAIKALPSAQPEQRWIPCGKCIHADGKNRRCKVLDRSINEDYFCYWAEPFREEGGAE